MNDKKERFKYLEGYIGVGKVNARSQKAIAEDLGVTPATVKHDVTEARKAGVLIASNTRGYYYAETVEEMREFVNLLQAQAKTRNDTAKPFIEAIKAIKKD